MKILFDTSALIAAVVQAHPRHNKALPWLKNAKAEKMDFYVCSHSLAEIYAVLTSMPLQPKINGETALRLINENIIEHAKIVPLAAKDYISVIKNMSDLGLHGGTIYDALIICAAVNAKVDRILTLDDDFKRLYREEKPLIECL